MNADVFRRCGALEVSLHRGRRTLVSREDEARPHTAKLAQQIAVSVVHRLCPSYEPAYETAAITHMSEGGHPLGCNRTSTVYQLAIWGMPTGRELDSIAEERETDDRSQHARAVAGCQVLDCSGEEIGSINEVWLDGQTGRPVWASVSTGLLGLRETSALAARRDTRWSHASFGVEGIRSSTLRRSSRPGANRPTRNG
jgi:hypothetical protein